VSDQQSLREPTQACLGKISTALLNTTCNSRALVGWYKVSVGLVNTDDVLKVGEEWDDIRDDKCANQKPL
jgi:hypothetical protein